MVRKGMEGTFTCGFGCVLHSYGYCKQLHSPMTLISLACAADTCI